MSAILDVKNLTHKYSGQSNFINDAVSNVSFSVNSGEIVGIIGHTGSGKSTLVQHLNGLLKPTEGEIYLYGKNIWENPKEIRRVRFEVGLVFQYPEYQLFEETVFEDIAFGPKNMGLMGEELESRVKEICQLIGIKEEYFSVSPFDLSGGEKRRVAIAGVMAMRPRVIIFDEPIAGLDPKGRQDVIKMIRDYRDAYNATVLIISHNMEDMATLTDKLLVMNNGNLTMFDETYKVFSRSEELKGIGLNVPIVTRVLALLKEKGVNIPDNILTVDNAVKTLLSLNKGGEAND
ncbi:MAG: energy-coupling factor transporter ATPase [Clostridia bacterium]|nr:energy-coupling factor transporter ATPase [Clostridia bacterium]